MTLQKSGQISARDILTEDQTSGTMDVDADEFRRIARKLTPKTQIAWSDFYGKNRGYCLFSYQSTPVVPWGYNPAWGNNPGDASAWPYSIWNADPENQGAYTSGSSYWPLIAPGGDLYYTMGCDNYGDIAYATTSDQYAQPASLSYTTIASGVGFPGINNWPKLGTFPAYTNIWFKCSWRDVGYAVGFTFAISTTASSAGIVTNSRMLTSDGYPYFCSPGATLVRTAPPYTYAQFAKDNGFDLVWVTTVAVLYTSNTNYSSYLGKSFYGLYRKPDYAGLKYWVSQYINKPFMFDGPSPFEQLIPDFYNGSITSGEYYTRGNTDQKTFYGGSSQGDFLDPPAGYT